MGNVGFAQNCDCIPLITNGEIVISAGFISGSKAHLVCDRGYLVQNILKYHVPVKCNEDGAWVLLDGDDLPKCIIGCFHEKDCCDHLTCDKSKNLCVRKQCNVKLPTRYDAVCIHVYFKR